MLEVNDRAGRVKILVGMYLIGLIGCASTPRDELAWQAMHGVDVAQTVQISRHPECFREITSAYLIGRHPDLTQVAAWAVAEGYGHWWVSDWLSDHLMPRTRRIWEAITIGYKGYTVHSNDRQGIYTGNATCSSPAM